MSGPKSSRYTLSARQRQIVQERLRKIQEAQIEAERKRNILLTLDENCSRLRETVNNLEATVQEAEKSASDQFDHGLDFSSTRMVVHSALEVISQVVSLKQKAINIKEIEKVEQEVLSQLNAVYAEAHKTQRRIENQNIELRDEALKGLASGFELSFANLAKPKRQFKVQTVDFLELITERLDKLFGLTISEEQKRRFEELRQKAETITSPDYLESFFSISVVPFVKDCIEYDMLYREKGNDYEQLRLRYEFLSKKLKHSIEEIPFSEQAISVLLEKIAFLEAEELEIEEESYICECIDEAMREMNYSVIGNRTVVKKNGRQFRNVLYRFAEGTAVNVTYSNNGQIAMELGGTTYSDKIPNEVESSSLEQDMKIFCNDFYIIEEKLKARGIESKRLSHLPAEAQFAQLINVSDYEMTEDIGEYEAKDQHRRGVVTQRTLYRER